MTPDCILTADWHIMDRTPKCRCGCGKSVKWGIQKNTWNSAISGHQNRGTHNPMFNKRGKKCPIFGRKRLDMIGNKNPAKRPDIRKKLKENHAKGMLGKHHTKEARENISKNHRNISGKNNPMYQKGYTIVGNKNPAKKVEVREKISNTLKGKYAGDKNPAWLGGISFEPYGINFNKALKEQIRNRDNRICQLCDCKENSELHCVHHINYNKKNNSPNNLITLCRLCHVKTNHNRKKWNIYFMNILSKNNI